MAASTRCLGFIITKSNLWRFSTLERASSKMLCVDNFEHTINYFTENTPAYRIFHILSFYKLKAVWNCVVARKVRKYKWESITFFTFRTLFSNSNHCKYSSNTLYSLHWFKHTISIIVIKQYSYNVRYNHVYNVCNFQKNLLNFGCFQ